MPNTNHISPASSKPDCCPSLCLNSFANLNRLQKTEVVTDSEIIAFLRAFPDGVTSRQIIFRFKENIWVNGVKNDAILNGLIASIGRLITAVGDDRLPPRYRLKDRICNT